MSNPGFEEMIKCPRILPTNPNNPTISLFTKGWENLFFMWWAFGEGQYYHECANRGSDLNFNWMGGVNNIPLGNMKNYYGKAFAGITVSTAHFKINYNSGLTPRVLLGANLVERLVPNHRYKFAYKIYSADSNYVTVNKFGAGFFTNKTIIDPRIGKDSIGRELWDYSGYKPQIQSDSIIQPGYWNTVRGEFIADSAYAYLIIGNFGNYTHMEQVPIRFPIENYMGNLSLFFIDEVELYDITKQIGNKQNNVCLGDSIFIWTENLTENHYWSSNVNGSDTISINDTLMLKPSNETKVYLFEKNTGLIDSLIVGVIDNKVNILPTDTFFCEETSITIEPFINGDSYQWSNGSTNKAVQLFDAGVFWLALNYYGCIILDSIEVNTCKGSIFFPNSFTPNGDGLNDVFMPVTRQIDNYSLDIFDRWGNNIFTIKDAQKGWNGFSSNGVEQPADVYFYISSYRINNKIVSSKGTFNLLR